MDEGKRFGLKKLLRFNGHFFADQTTSPPDPRGPRRPPADHAGRLGGRGAEHLRHALHPRPGPEERHRLGAEFTPRDYVERLLRPTIEEPVRERWELVQAEVVQLKPSQSSKKKDQRPRLERLRDFHEWLRSLRILDPACGSGNFLYVALSILKQIELEVIREIEAITGQREIAVEEVGPAAVLRDRGGCLGPGDRRAHLWIGYHQWWRRTHGHIQPPEPVLRDTGTLECRDAVLAWDEIVHVPEKDRPDPTPRIEHPVTGSWCRTRGEAEVPGVPRSAAGGVAGGGFHHRESAVHGPRPACARRSATGTWTRFGPAYPDVPRMRDYVMYWWQTRPHG
jgi:hypothetical protein